MPAISHQEFQTGAASLHAREWRNTVGQSGMTPTAFAFLIPVFVVAIAAPFLCVFCIRKRRRNAPPIRPVKTKKPALPRAEAREILNTVTDISHVTSEKNQSHAGHIEDRTVAGDTRSFVERECAICLSALFAPAPPEPVKLANESTLEEIPIATAPSIKDVTTSEPEAILKLQVCSHEFHAECLVSWFALRKTSCPICRAVFFSKEAMQLRDDEAQLAEQEAAPPAPEPAPVISNWRYFLHGRNVFSSQNQNTPATPMTAQPARSTPPSQV